MLPAVLVTICLTRGAAALRGMLSRHSNVPAHQWQPCTHLRQACHQQRRLCLRARQHRRQGIAQAQQVA